MGISASSELGRAILRQHPEILASTTKAERAAKREALTWRGIVFKSKTEMAFAKRCEATDPGAWRYEPFTLHLPGGVSYTPDIQLINSRALVEVKPAARLPRERDSIVRLKVAAASFPEFRFYLARLLRGGEWEISEVTP